jgi:hypothetical protein
LFAAVLICAALALGACASKSGGTQGSTSEPAPAQKAAPAEKTTAKPPPAGSPLSKVEIGMSDAQVRGILGEPDGANSYPTAKGFMPYYYGGDTTRTDWVYSGQGRVVFTINRYSGALKVIRVDYDPNL